MIASVPPLIDTVPPLVGVFVTLGDALLAAGQQFGDREACVDGTRRLSFAQWARASSSLARELRDRGVGPGDIVSILLPSSADYAIAYGAITLAGAIASGINLRLGAYEVAAIFERARPAAVFVDSDASAFSVPEAAFVIDRSELAQLCAGEPIGCVAPNREAADAAVIIWTSGTTGTPKGSWFDHRNLYAAVASAGVMSAPFDRKLSGTPFAHAGFMAKVWDQLAWASTLVISPTPWTAASMLQLLVDERITVAGGVPTQWSKLLELPGVVDADLSALRVGLVATAPASPELIERVAASIGCPLVVRYAMTESPSITGTECDDSAHAQSRTVGRPQRGMEVSLIDDDGAPVTQVTVGRATDMYIRGGYNVYPLEVENVLAEHTGVSAVAIVGMPADVIGEVGVAFVVPIDIAEPPTLE